MFHKNYKPIDVSVWQGRIDSHDDYDAFRWHQCIAPIDLRDKELKPNEEKLAFAFIGFCCDLGVQRNKGRSGAEKGPQSIRKEMANLPCRFDKSVRLFDAGDVLAEDCTLEESQEILSKAVEKLLSLNFFPIVLGGGHEVAFGHYNGILDYLKSKEEKPKIGIINFDAHFDLRPYTKGGSSGTMFRQIADICKEQSLEYSYLCLGVQTHRNTVDLFRTADRLGAHYIPAKDVANNDSWSILDGIDNFIKDRDHLYITICTDVFSSAFAPGVSATQPLGLNPEKILQFLKYILKTGKVVSFDIAEVSPRFDQDNTTANLAAVMIFSVISTVCFINDLSYS